MLHIKSHTGLRGFLALSVTALHLNIDLAFPQFQTLGMFGWFNGALCVDLFFLLSGFILSVIYDDKLDKSSSRNYVVARVARIFPLHTVCLLLVFVMYIIGSWLGVSIGNDYAMKDFFVQLLLIHEWYPLSVNQWIKTSWSVSFEWLAYLLCFPVFSKLSQHFKFCNFSNTSLLCLATLFMLICFSTYICHYEYNLSRMTGIPGVVRSFSGFISGCFLAKAFCNKSVKLSPKWDNLFFLFIIGSCILKELLSPYFILIAYVIAPLWVLHLAYDRDSITVKLLSSRVMVFLGLISYSLYLIHPIVGKIFYGLHTKLPEINGFWIVVALLSVTLLSSFFSYKFLEIPSRNYLRKKYSK